MTPESILKNAGEYADAVWERMHGTDLRDRVAEIKSRLDLRGMAKRHGIELPDRPGVKFRSPFRADEHPSCALWIGASGELLLRDYSTGETMDCLDLAAAARGVAVREIIRALADELDAGRAYNPPPRRVRAVPAPAQPPRPAPTLPALRKGSVAELRRLADLRGIPLVGLDFAQMRGLLWFASLRGTAAWVVTDSDRINAQARRLDGRTWDHLPGPPKAWTLKNCIASHPIGLPTVQRAQNVLLVEGGPDLLAAAALIYAAGREGDTATVAMTGASLRIPKHERQAFAGRHVRIIPHADRAGAEALPRWAEDLRAGGAAAVDAFDLTGLPGKDLNDALRADPAALHDLIPATR